METVPNFTPRAQEAIEIAKQAAQENSSSVLDVFHLAYGVLSLKSRNILRILEKTQIDPDGLDVYILSLIELNKNFAQQGSEKFVFSHHAKQVLTVAAACAEKMGHGYVGLEHLFLSLSQYADSPINTFAVEIGVDPRLIAAAMKRQFSDTEMETVGGVPEVFADESFDPPVAPQNAPLEYLSRFAVNFNELAINKKLDTIVGREEEIKEVSEILCQKKKNNPILLGDPGVGKTAVVEGLAQLITSGEAAEFLLPKIIYGLDLGMLIAGTKYRGQFEDRLKKIIKEVSASEETILFVDEIHTLIGAGSAEGTMDAANMLKPALARGEIVCIGATTYEEHKKTIAKDGALDRRFQPVKIEAPSKTETLQILKGIRPHYEEFHGVQYSDEALELCVHLSDKYIGDKHFPDKAIDLLDQSGAKAKIQHFKRPQEAKDMEHKIESLMMEEDEDPSNKQIKEKQEDLFSQYQALLVNWAQKKDKKGAKVSERYILESAAQRAKIPLDSLCSNSTQKFLNLNKRLNKIIIGQTDAIDKIYNCLLRGHTPLKEKGRPFGAFMCLGASGVGKTYLAKTLAREVFGGENKLIQLDMSEYSDKISATRMVGASPGYVGYEEGGQLTEKVRKNPYSVVLFDEIEKADVAVCQMLLQILEEGKLTDNFGRETSFANCVIILTGNVGAPALKDTKNMGFLDVMHDKKGEVLKEAKGFFKPEFLNRLDEVIVFETFTDEDLKKIVKIEVNKLKLRLKDVGVNLKITAKIFSLLTEKAIKRNDGARPVKRLIQEHLENPMAPLLIEGENNIEVLAKNSTITVVAKKIKKETHS
jgi:ATP-dependent Clp protease ATP-binding subunit ClpC